MRRASPIAHVNGLLEIPVTTTRLMARNLPAGGGGYFRLAPYRGDRAGPSNASTASTAGRRSSISIPGRSIRHQPRVDGISAKTRFRHYLNLDRTEGRLKQLLRDFHWDRVDRVFDLDAA